MNIVKALLTDPITMAAVPLEANLLRPVKTPSGDWDELNPTMPHTPSKKLHTMPHTASKRNYALLQREEWVPSRHSTYVSL